MKNSKKSKKIIKNSHFLHIRALKLRVGDEKMQVKSKQNLVKICALIFMLVLLPVVILFAGCGEVGKSITSIEKTDSTGLVDTYTITYSDGSTYDFTITNGANGLNGADGEDAVTDYYDVYQSAVEQGYSGSYIDFLSTVLSAEPDNSYAVNVALLSSVSVYCDFTQDVYDFNWMGQYYKAGERAYQSIGSGIIYKFDKDSGTAYIITNYHVVYSANSNAEKISNSINIYLYGSSDTAIPATYVGGAMNYDIAVLKVENSDFLKTSNARAVDLATEEVAVGDSAIAVGNPEALGISATQGIISVDSEYMTMTGPDNVTQITFRSMRIDTSINSGNSGGGLFNNKGELIGIVNSKANSSTIENIAYAIPLDIAIGVAENAIYYNDGGIQVYTLGATLTGENSYAYYDEENSVTRIREDVVVTAVSGSVASEIALQSGDVITSIAINGVTTTITRAYMVDDLMLTIRPDDEVTINFTRSGQSMTATITASSDDFTEYS